MKPTTIRGTEYFPILNKECVAEVGDKQFACAFRRRGPISCALMGHERSCNLDRQKDFVIFLSKEDQALAVMLGAEAPT